MSAVDLRKPALVGDDFRARVASRVAPLGFAARAQNKALVRKRGKNVHRIAFGSSHYNTAGQVTAWVRLEHEDFATRRLVASWRAGGQLDGPAFSLDVATNVADAAQAGAVADVVAQQIAFFDRLEDPPAIAAEVMRRYLPGLVDPVVIAPYLRAHLGEAAVFAYADALLRGRPELAPAFMTALDDDGARDPSLPDHGTQLARAVQQHGGGQRPEIPSGTVRSTTARALRASVGLQLRAWGEPEAAHALRTVGDSALIAVHDAQKALDTPLVDSAEAARLALALALRVDRMPRRSAASPRLFQYHARHEPFGRG